MKDQTLTQTIRDGISRDERTRYDEAYLLLRVFERYGFVLTDAQREVVASLPKPASVMRIAKRELKARRAKRTLL
jgi:uncharacterized protein YllA (UPF0747 family)